MDNRESCTPVKYLRAVLESRYNWSLSILRWLVERKSYRHQYPLPSNYLRLAELVAKVTFNASGQPAPFDTNSGHYIASLALKATEYFDDNRLEEKVKSAINYSNRKQQTKIDRIIKQIKTKQMPLMSYILLHQNAILNETDKKTLIDFLTTYTIKK